jgi:predicted DNA-binding transcriptional regulator AlpA
MKLERKLKRYLRRKHLAERYQTGERSIDRMVRDGTLPKPDLVVKRSPLWDEANLEEHERISAVRGR